MELGAQQKDRVAGVLVATAAGDALGAGYEFTHPRPDAAIDMIGGGPGPFVPGEWTDDTSMTLAIAEVSASGVPIAGGDTDTTAAIAGGLLGARWGASSVPERWKQMLHGWPGYRVGGLIELAQKTAANAVD
ncbi:ADP-ribosylglycohydrolase family protein [Rhodococcus artemisiae]|uniref:ADP-ribosylglycohydrolase family protein n=1 Tax=Rhodococcus artemisiae TaxID=714159 RepID=A0ABU7LIT0_9NOCA|nr:ADP-ribosylglycohydrolase family protein [Rhodococcus artemisiae]MEE2060807.1 ADP-ribosylglycohydrolase family protein [Rhodococcus artemisiae]